jgi:hypothetical protein
MRWNEEDRATQVALEWRGERVCLLDVEQHTTTFVSLFCCANEVIVRYQSTIAHKAPSDLVRNVSVLDGLVERFVQYSWLI